MRKFYLGLILSVSTGKLFTDVSSLYIILNYMTGDELFTHQLPRARRECAPSLVEQLPFLKDINVSNVDTTNWKRFLDRMVKEHGKYHFVKPLDENEHEFIHPFEEAAEMMRRK